MVLMHVGSLLTKWTALQLWIRGLCICCCSSEESHGGKLCVHVRFIVFEEPFFLYWFIYIYCRWHIIWEEKIMFSGVVAKVINLFWTQIWSESLIIWYVNNSCFELIIWLHCLLCLVLLNNISGISLKLMKH